MSTETHDQLMAALRERPDDEDAWAVLRDWLLQHDDPRARLWDAPPAQESLLLEKLGMDWFDWEVAAKGNVLWIHEVSHQDYAFRLQFEHGHVRVLEVFLRNGTHPEWLRSMLARVLSLPVGQLVLELRLHASLHELDLPLIETLLAAAPLAVRTLRLDEPDCRGLWAAAPHLESVSVVAPGDALHLGELHHDKLRELELACESLPAEPLQALAAARLPALQRLDLTFAEEDRSPTCSPDDLLPLLQRDFPALRHVRLHRCELASALMPQILAAPWLGHLETLSLQESVLHEAGGLALLAGADSLRHLRRLELDQCFLDETWLERLRRALGERVIGEVREDWVFFDDELP